MSDYFIFDNIDTRNYEGISVYFDEVDTTPKRVGEFIEIPNRNGSLFLDSGRYEDVTHTYDIIALSMQNGRNLINALASKVGHHRLEDSFNTGEYYSAVFDAEVEPTVTMERDKITFKVIFTRKPQRWLTSGETAVTVANNGTLTNPTLFESSPLLAVTGYGTIGFNGYEIELENAVLGEIRLALGSSSRTKHDAKQIAINTTNLNTDDTIYVQGDLIISEDLTPTGSTHAKIGFNSVTSSTNVKSAYGTESGTLKVSLTIVPDLSAGFVYGTASTITSSATYSYRLIGSSTNYSETISVSVAYDGDDTITITTTRTGTLPTGVKRQDFYSIAVPPVYGYSTKSLLGNPTYIDCDLGEAYRIDGDTITSLNQHIDLGSDLPKLASGTNTFTKSNTVTQLKVTPRWWRV